jgi:hypothetical protein
MDASESIHMIFSIIQIRSVLSGGLEIREPVESVIGACLSRSRSVDVPYLLRKNKVCLGPGRAGYVLAGEILLLWECITGLVIVFVDL